MTTTTNLSDLLRPLQNPPEWSESSESVILEPFVYLSSKPGKEIRSLLIEAFNLWLDVPRPQLYVISRVVRMLHSASLMIDDIEDDSQLRRGQPVTHRIYGIPQTINTANYVYFLAYKELAVLRSLDQSPGNTASSSRLVANRDLDLVVTEELLSLHRGQGLEIFWRDTLQCPTEEEYIAMVNNSEDVGRSHEALAETGGLFRIAVKLMMACATRNVDVDYVPLVNLFGVYFQIRDDFMNLQSTEYSNNKGFAEDLTEGKFSFPIVHGVRADQSNRVILNVLQKRPTTPTLKHHTISHLRNNTGSLSYTLKIMRELEQMVRGEITRLGGNSQLEAILAALHVENDLDQ